MNQAIVHATDQQTVFEEACRIAHDVGNFKMCWIGLFDVPLQTINLVASSGMSADLANVFVGLVYENGGATGIRP
jgi:GAF domain-containing protein